MGKITDRIKLIQLKREFNEIYDLVLMNNKRYKNDKIRFSDGTSYTQDNLRKKFEDIDKRVNDLSINVNYVGRFCLLSAIAYKGNGFSKISPDRLIELYDREPVYVENVIIENHKYSGEFVRSKYYESYKENTPIDEVIKQWFEITASEIDEDGIHEFRDVKIGKNLCDPTKYGKSFIESYPEFFVEDIDVPKAIKRKFYNTELTIDEYEKYAKEFEGKTFGLGIYDSTGLAYKIGNRNFTELIKEDIVGIKYLHEDGGNTSLDRRIGEFKDLETIEEIKNKYNEIMQEEVNTKKKSVLRGYTKITYIRDTEFLRTRLPELLLDDNAPEKLKEKYYTASLEIEDLTRNPEWIEWLEGKDEFVKAQLVDEHVFDDWRYYQDWLENPKVNDYMSLLYEDELRKFIITRRDVVDSAITDVFKKRNPDLFFDDLPKKLRRHFEKHDWSFSDVFELSPSKKKLLEGKQIQMALINGAERDFCEEYGGDYEAFKIYEKYAGVLDLVVSSDEKYLYGDEGLEEMIKQAALSEIIDTDKRYDDRVPEEFKRNSPYFLDSAAPEELKKVFYRMIPSKMDFCYLRNNPEYVPFIKGKFVRNLFDKEYKDFFEFCENQDKAIELGIKYGDHVEKLSFSASEKLSKNGEELLIKKIYESIKNTSWNYGDLPDDFKLRNPELFLMEEDLAKISHMSDEEKSRIVTLFYNRKISFEFLKHYPELVDIMKTKNISRIWDGKAEYLLELFNGDKNKLIDVAIEYGDVLLEPIFIEHYSERKDEVKADNVREVLDELIYSAITEKELYYSAELPDSFKIKHPELFLLPEDLDGLDDEDKDLLEREFYNKNIYLNDLKYQSAVKEIISKKNLSVCGRNRGKILDRFTEIVGTKEKAFNLITGKFAEKLDKIADRGSFEEDLEKAIIYYKEVGFIPDLVILDKLAEDKIKGFALNRKLWRKIVEDMQSVDADTLGSLLEAAMVMGVFETKEFTRNGTIMTQGNGEKGFKKLQEFLNYMPRYFGNRFSVEGEEAVEYRGLGYIRRQSDFFEELIYEKLELAAIDRELLDEFLDGSLDSYDAERIIDEVNSEAYLVDQDECFEEDIEEYYHCIVDRNIDEKIKMMLKTLGIKDDEVLFEDQYKAIEECDEDYVKVAFDRKSLVYWKRKDKNGNAEIEDTYRFNISQIDDKFVIGEDYDIDEEQSRANKRLFDYIRFLMAEYGLEAEAARLGANNDRSNINLILSQEKMNILCEAANKISQAELSRYSGKSDIWELKKGIKYDYVSDNKIHQLFDGMKMEYNKEFSEFILDNIREIFEDDELFSRINPIQEQVIQMSNDPDYAGIELTPAIVLRALSKVKYIDKKVGFEKGEELAQKFAFDQEYFNIAQEIWDEARKRKASTIPRVKGQEGRCSYEVLRLDDAMGIYAGNITTCCQKLGGAGETSMLHSMKEKHGRVFVVRDERQRIIAQSWLWRNGDTICFDNVEIPNVADSKENQDAIYDVLKKVAKKLCDKDAEIVDKLVAEGKIDEKTGELMKAKKVTVGQGNTDIDEIACNEDKELQDDECKSPIETGKIYKGTDEERLYISDSIDQIVLYKVSDYKREESQPNRAIHYDENIEKNCLELTNSEIKTMWEIEREIDDSIEVTTIPQLAEKYGIKPEELNVVLGIDWFMLYSEKEDEVTVHKMYKSPSSGILKKSVREQREAIKMIINKGKKISMNVENDRVHRAARAVVRHMEKRYTMKVADEGDRIRVSEIEMR